MSQNNKNKKKYIFTTLVVFKQKSQLFGLILQWHLLYVRGCGNKRGINTQNTTITENMGTYKSKYYI